MPLQEMISNIEHISDEHTIYAEQPGILHPKQLLYQTMKRWRFLSRIRATAIFLKYLLSES